MTTAKFERRRKTAVREFGEALDQADALLKQAAVATGERASDLRSQVEAQLLSAKMKLYDLQDDALDTAKAAARATHEYVSDNPWQGVGAGAALGFIIGVLVSRR
jgi:ElaB/YqjD/DUF883 family membrane-anchored ribosome-binding protein